MHQSFLDDELVRLFYDGLHGPRAVLIESHFSGDGQQQVDDLAELCCVGRLDDLLAQEVAKNVVGDFDEVWEEELDNIANKRLISACVHLLLDHPTA